MNIEKAVELPFDTPFLVIDIDRVRRNITRMQSVANENGKCLRPHSKTHKIPELSRMQISAGASGICVQKVSEAEVMFSGSVDNILLSNEIIGRKMQRFADLLSRNANATLAVDNYQSVKELSAACRYYGVTAHVLIDVDVGMNRCGVAPADFEKLLTRVKRVPNIVVDGIMAYDGQVNSNEIQRRQSEVEREEKIVAFLEREMKGHGIKEACISVGGTPTAEIWAGSELITEIQPGTYVYYDIHCMTMGLCSLEDVAIGVVATAMSEKRGERVVLDAGYKSVAMDQGVFPKVFDERGMELKVLSMSEEHTVLSSNSGISQLGRRFVMLPYHACTTTDLWDSAYAISDKCGPRLMIIEARGKRA